MNAPGNIANLKERKYQPVYTSAPLANVDGAIREKVAQLENYIMKWDGGEEALQPCPGAATWGVVYALDLLDGERLDQEFSVRLDGTGSYFHYPAEVVDRQGNAHSVLLYMRNSFGAARPPSGEYLQRLVAGGRQMGLPEDYLTALAAHPAVPAAYPVPKGGSLRHIINLEQSDCHC